MTPLRQRMIEDLQLRGVSARPQERDVTAVRRLAAHSHTSPDRRTEEGLRQYCLYLATEKQVARATAMIARCGITCVSEPTRRRDWPILRFVRPPREKKLPVVLSREEGRRIPAEVRIPVYRLCLTTIYACGLRRLEGAHLPGPDGDSARMVLHIHGKGKKDRYVPLPTPTLERRRAYWRTPRSPGWLFPAPTRHGLPHALAPGGGPVTRGRLQRAFRRGLLRTGIAKRAPGVTLPAVEFLPRFLRHVLPRGCTKVRYSGLWSPPGRSPLERAHTLPSALPPEPHRCRPPRDRSRLPPLARALTRSLLTPSPRYHLGVIFPAPVLPGCSSTPDFVAAPRDKNP